MIYQSFLPTPPLSQFVRNYTLMHFRFSQQQAPPTKQRSPKAEQKIVFYLKGSVSIPNAKTGITHTPPPVALYSNQMDKRDLGITPEFQAFIIFFRPGVLHRMIRIPMPEFHPTCSDAELYFGAEVSSVREQLSEAKDVAAMRCIAEKFLLNRFRQVETKSAVDHIAAHMLTDPTSFSLDALADQACLSTKQFYRKFIQRMGMSPKLFSRLSRFNLAYQYKLNHPYMSWSSIAQQLCYTDYHHLEKEFKAFIGRTPREWVKAELTAPERILKLR